MTISSEATRKAGPYSCNGAVVTFSFSFKVFAQTDIVVTLLNSVNVESELTLTTDYTVSLNADQNSNPGGSITTTATYASGNTITLSSEVPFLNELDLTNAGGYYLTALNQALDRLTILAQQVRDTSNRTLLLSITSASSVDLTLPTPYGNSVIGWNTDGDALTNYPLTELGDAPSLQALLGASEGSTLIGHDEITLAEKLNEMVSADQYGAAGDGVTDDSTYWQNLVTDQVNSVAYGTGGKTYKIGTAINLPITRGADLTIDGRMCTFKPSGTSFLFQCSDLDLDGSGFINTTAGDFNTTVVSGATNASRQVVLTTVTGLSVGDICMVHADNDPTEQPYNYPAAWRKVLAIDTGTKTVTLDTPFEFAYTGTIYFKAWTGLKGTLYLKNMIIDGSLRTYSATVETGCCFQLWLYERVIFENVRIINFQATTYTKYIQFIDTYVCRHVVTDKLSFNNNVSLSSATAFRQMETLNQIQTDVHGDHFGLAAEEGMYWKAVNCHLQGLRAQEADFSPATNTSVRGFKALGCGVVEWTNCTANDYESPFKVEVADRFYLSGPKSFNAGQFTYSGQNAINISTTVPPGRATRGEVVDAMVHYCGGNAIVADSTVVLTVRNPDILRCYGYAIFTGSSSVEISGGRITGWGYGTPGTIPAIYLSATSGSPRVDGVEFRNDSDTTAPCMDIRTTAARIGMNNISLSGNPLFGASNVARQLIELDEANRLVVGRANFSGYRKDGSVAQIGSIGNWYGFAVTNTQTFTFTATCKVFAIATGGGASAFFFADYKSATITILGNPSSEFENSSTPTAGKTGVYKSANSHTISVYNNTGSTVNYQVLNLGLVFSNSDPV